MKNIIAPLVMAVLLWGCGGATESTGGAAGQTTTPTGPVRIVLVGDIMTGRGVAGILERDSDAVFAGIRHILNGADLAAGNLESPLTRAPHLSANENQLEADPATAIGLAAAGFDLMSLPNNHSTDAGGNGLVDTIAAVEAAGIITIGAGTDEMTAYAPTVVEIADLAIGFLAYDATGVGIRAGAGPGIAGWGKETAVAAVRDLRSRVDVVVVSVHGGTEYLPVTDPGMAVIGDTLAAAGADVVWGHGAHVVQPVFVIDGTRPTVTATSLGNFLFDQSGTDRTTGAILEVVADDRGVIAYRVGMAEHPDRRIEFVEWIEPNRDAAWLDGSWWSLIRTPRLAANTTIAVDGFRHGDLVAAATGNVTGDGTPKVIASFRRPHQTTPFMELHPELQWADASGRSAHLGVYEPGGLNEIWVAGSVLMPIAQLQICDGAIATAHNQLDDPAVVAGGAWVWNGFGFDTAPDVPGPGSPGCADVDGDGRTEPVFLGR